MIDAGHHPHRISRWLLASALIVLTTLACQASTAFAASLAEEVGLAHRYTYSDSNCTKAVDPINVVWEEEPNAAPENRITADRVANAIAAHDWPRDDYKSVVFKAARALHAGDIGYQWIVRSDGKCVRDSRQMTDGSPAGSRFHVRLFETSYKGRYFVVGDAHRDQKHQGDGCDTVKIPPTGPTIASYGHVATSFDEARTKMLGNWPGSRALKTWGNTQPMKQCNGQYTASNGEVLYLGQFGSVSRAGVTYTSLSEPTISGAARPGLPLTVNPGSWSPTPSIISYQWCRENLETDSCAPIAGATGATWTPSNSDIGQQVSVLVTPSSGEAETAQAVEIHAGAPTARTNPVNEVGLTTAKFTGWVNPEGTPTVYFFEYGKTTAYGNLFPSPAWSIGSGTSEGWAWNDITGLEPATTYHVRIVAVNSYGATYGNDQVFTTVGPPTVTTEPATEITTTTAQMMGKVNPNGIATTYWLEYGKTLPYDYTIPYQAPPGLDVGSGFGDVPVGMMRSVEAGATYHYRFAASNAAGKAFGADRTFTALDYPPGAATRLPTQVGETTARLNGVVFPNKATSYYFQLGKTTAYGSSYPTAPILVGEAPPKIPVFYDASGLEPGVTYHYRLVATNWSGSRYGEDQTFKTWSPYTPRVEATPPAEVTQSKIAMTSKIDVRGLEGWYYFEYGNTDRYGSQTEEVFAPVGSGYQQVSAPVEGLPVGSTIHYRVVVRNEDRTVYGPDQAATTAWTNEPSSAPNSSKSDWLQDVSCPSAGNCIAVGGYLNSATGNTAAAAERWNGTSWTPIEPPTPAGTYSELKGVSCLSATNCIAVGSALPAANSARPLIMQWNGSAWSEIPAGSQVPSGYQNYLNDVSCPAANSCEAVGYSAPSSGATKTLAMHWDGTAWTVRATPSLLVAGGQPAQEDSALEGVSCATTTFCKGVGWTKSPLGEPAKFEPRAVIERLLSSEWLTEPTDLGPQGSVGYTYLPLKGVSCPTTSMCMAVGIADGNADEYFQRPLVQRWSSGGKWTNEWTPYNETMSPMGLSDVSCSSATSCRASGVEGRGERWTGSEWRLQVPARPADLAASQAPQLSGIACPTATECHAVGSYRNTAAATVRLTQGWSATNATLHTLADSPTPVTEFDATLRAFVDPAGTDAKYYFEYGPTTAYGTKTAEAAAGSGGLDFKGGAWVAVNAAVSDLDPGRTYHYRVVATNGVNTAYGPDTTFETKNALGLMPVTEAFSGGTSPVSDFATKWAPLQWTGSAKKGNNNPNGYGPVDTTANGAYFMPPIADVVPDVGSVGLGAQATIATGPGVGGRVSLWLDMSSPATVKTGYELSLQETGANLYTVTLKKWVNGVETQLASKTGYSLPAGSKVALVDTGLTVRAYGDTGGGLARILSVVDKYPTLAGGNAGIEVAGSTATRVTNFRYGILTAKTASLDASVAAMGVTDTFDRQERPLSLSGSWSALAWDTATAVKTGMTGSGYGWTPIEPTGGTIAGAYWKEMASDTGTGDVVSATANYAYINNSSYYSALWLNMPNPAAVKSGYQLRIGTTATAVELKLIKWVGGVATTLATKTGMSIAGGLSGTKFALVDKGGTVSVWTAPPGGAFAQTLSAADTTYSYGYAGMEGASAAGAPMFLRDLKLGPLPLF